ncbi:MAG: FecR domain-containing protein [Candidatus Gracilibacteria bacterium]|nr:FecR domain-containing protein [Candidatus Gracilibacteria bacterium]
MLKIKNKFIIFIITIILGIVVGLIYNSQDKKDLESYVVLMKGQAFLNDEQLKVQDRNKLAVGDMVKTVTNDSLAVLEWGDGSVTRLGGNSSIEINEMHISNDLTSMNISFNLLSGKTWSNVVSFFGEGSYFKENFRDTEAAVRGTIFDVDLNKDYLYVVDHKVQLTNGSGDVIEVTENNPINLQNFSFIGLERFIKSFKDVDWEQSNLSLDNQFVVALRSRLDKDIKNISKYRDLDINSYLNDSEKKQELYNELLSNYQKLNFVKSDDIEFFNAKLELKDKLLQLSDESNKSILVNSTLYDFKEMLDAKRYESTDLLLGILSKNSDKLNDIDLKSYFEKVSIPDEIKQKISDKFSNLNDFFMNTFDTFKSVNVGIDDIKNLNDKAKGLIHEGLDSLFDK